MGRLTEAFAFINNEQTPNSEWVKTHIKSLDVDSDMLKLLQKIRRDKKKSDEKDMPKMQRR